MLKQIYLISLMSGQFCRAEARLAAPVAVRLAPQNLEMRKKTQSVTAVGVLIASTTFLTVFERKKNIQICIV